MAKNRQEIPRAERVQGIVDIASELLAARDFADVSIEDIARQVGVRGAAVYWYFESKDHILAAVLENLHDDCARRLSELPDEMSASDRLVLHLAEHRHMRLVHAAAHSRMRVSSVVATAHAKLLDQFHQLVESVLAECSVEDHRLLGGLLITLFEGANDPGYRGPSATELTVFVLEKLSPPRSRRQHRTGTRPRAATPSPTSTTVALD